MDTVRLGRTGLEVSVAGLGCGGHSRLGISQGEEHGANIVRRALDLGVTFIDTAAAYGTEGAVGAALRGRDRNTVVISTKSGVYAGDQWNLEPEVMAPERLRTSVEESLTRLGTDYIDIMNLHGVVSAQYPACVERLVPELLALKQEGKIRFLGITELFQADTEHTMLSQAVAHDHFDVVMVGLNFLNPSAHDKVLRPCIEKDIGTQIMFAVRKALRSRQALQPLLDHLAAQNRITPLDASAVEAVLTGPGRAADLPEAAYRYCRHAPGAHVTLTGTGSPAHLEANIRSILAPPLPPDALAALDRWFGQVTTVTAGEDV